MTLELPNYTIIIQFLFFVGTFLVLNRFVFSPLLVVVEERRKKTSGAHVETIRLSKEATEVLASYQDKMRSYRDELRSMRELANRELSKNASAHIANSREKFIETMKETKKSISGQLLEAQTSLATELSIASKEIVTRFIGKKA